MTKESKYPEHQRQAEKKGYKSIYEIDKAEGLLKTLYGKFEDWKRKKGNKLKWKI